MNCGYQLLTARQVAIKVTITVLALVFAAPLPVFAVDYLNNPTVRVARHDKRPSKVKFPTVAESEEEPLLSWSTLYERHSLEQQSQIEQLVESYEELPHCKKSEVQLTEVHHHTRITDMFNVGVLR